MMDDELERDIMRIIEKYRKRYGKKGVKMDRLRGRIMVSLLPEILKRLER